MDGQQDVLALDERIDAEVFEEDQHFEEVYQFCSETTTAFLHQVEVLFDHAAQLLERPRLAEAVDHFDVFGVLARVQHAQQLPETGRSVELRACVVEHVFQSPQLDLELGLSLSLQGLGVFRLDGIRELARQSEAAAHGRQPGSQRRPPSARRAPDQQSDGVLHC